MNPQVIGILNVPNPICFTNEICPLVGRGLPHAVLSLEMTSKLLPRFHPTPISSSNSNEVKSLIVPEKSVRTGGGVGVTGVTGVGVVEGGGASVPDEQLMIVKTKKTKAGTPILLPHEHNKYFISRR